MAQKTELETESNILNPNARLLSLTIDTMDTILKA